ncbi:MAG: transglutaminase-like domain-containing protein [Planctomycetota bacterium]
MEFASQSTLRALISLLPDENPRVLSMVRDRLLEMGSTAVPQLRDASVDDDPRLRLRARDLLEEMEIRDLEPQVVELLRAEAPDLEEGAFLISRFAHRHLDVASYRELLDRMAEELRPRVQSLSSPAKIIFAVNSYLFGELGFHGNQRSYYEPDNILMHRVLDRRKGIQITLAIVYLLIAKRLSLPFCGIGLPGHFLVGYGDDKPDVFVDVFHRGKLLSRSDCRTFLEREQYGNDEASLEPATTQQILSRMVTNLVLVYHQVNDRRHESRFARLLQAMRPLEAKQA